MGWIMMAASVQYDVMAITTVTPRIQNVWGKKREMGLIAELALRHLSFSLLGSAGHRQHFQERTCFESDLVYIQRRPWHSPLGRGHHCNIIFQVMGKCSFFQQRSPHLPSRPLLVLHSYEQRLLGSSAPVALPGPIAIACILFVCPTKIVLLVLILQRSEEITVVLYLHNAYSTDRSDCDCSLILSTTFRAIRCTKLGSTEH